MVIGRRNEGKNPPKTPKVYTIITLLRDFRSLGLDSCAELPPPPLDPPRKAAPLICHTNVNLLSTRVEEMVHSATAQLLSSCTIDGICRRDTSFQTEGRSLAEAPWKANIFERNLQLNFNIYIRCYTHYVNVLVLELNWH